VYHPGIYPGHSGPLSLAIPPWFGAVSTGDGVGHTAGEETTSSVMNTVDPVTTAADVQAYAELGLTRLKGQRG